MGFLKENYSLVASVINLSTGSVIPQYNIVFDDLFQNLFSSQENKWFQDTIYSHLFDSDHDCYVEE